jgi:hypothetical protein
MDDKASHNAKERRLKRKEVTASLLIIISPLSFLSSLQTNTFSFPLLFVLLVGIGEEKGY